MKLIYVKSNGENGWEVRDGWWDDFWKRINSDKN